MRLAPLLLLASALLVLAPHSAHLPGWVSLLCALTLLWRAAITLQGNSVYTFFMTDNGAASIGVLRRDR